MQLRFRKKPVVIEAFLMTLARIRSNEDWPEWLHKAWNKDGGPGSLFIQKHAPGTPLHLVTLEGIMEVSPNDWIIRGVKGELYLCNPDIFAETYEQA